MTWHPPLLRTGRRAVDASLAPPTPLSPPKPSCPLLTHTFMPPARTFAPPSHAFVITPSSPPPCSFTAPSHPFVLTPSCLLLTLSYPLPTLLLLTPSRPFPTHCSHLHAPLLTSPRSLYLCSHLHAPSHIFTPLPTPLRPLFFAPLHTTSCPIPTPFRNDTTPAAPVNSVCVCVMCCPCNPSPHPAVKPWNPPPLQAE